MTSFENKIIDQFISEIILNSSLEDIDEKDQARIEQFLLSALAQQREELVKEWNTAMQMLYCEHCGEFMSQELVNKLKLTSSVPEEKGDK